MDFRKEERESTARMALPKATGEARYVSDIRIPGCLYGHVVRSPLPHAIIRSIDASEARRVPGVVAVVTAADIPGCNRLGKTRIDQPILADDKVRSVQDAIVLIAAESKEAALRAEAALILDLEPLPGVFSIEEALAPGAPAVHDDRPGNVLKTIHLQHGDLEQGFRQSDVIIDDSYQTPAIEHAYFEADNGVIEPQGDGYVIWIGCHSVYSEQQIASAVLNLPEDRITVIQPYTGGSFGGKDDGLLTGYLALLAHFAKRPVRISFSRRELFVSHTKRHPQWVHIRMGLTRDGRITAAKYQIQTDTGAYAHWGEGIFTFASIGASGPYNIPNIQVDTQLVYTNNVPFGAMRAWGMPGVTFAMESHLDQAAQKLGLHPLVIRWRNAAVDGDLMATGWPLPEGVHIRETIEAAANHFRVNLEDK